jgi:hypothetical protein
MSDRKATYRRAHMEQGVCDERGAVFHATAARLPNGAYGMCVLGVRGNLLSIYDTGSQAGVGQRLYTIPLNQVKDVQINDSFFAEVFRGCTLRFAYKNFTFKFKNAYAQKQALAVIRSEIQRPGEERRASRDV